MKVRITFQQDQVWDLVEEQLDVFTESGKHFTIPLTVARELFNFEEGDIESLRAAGIEKQLTGGDKL
jgi:hypothetical protein